MSGARNQSGTISSGARAGVSARDDPGGGSFAATGTGDRVPCAPGYRTARAAPASGLSTASVAGSVPVPVGARYRVRHTVEESGKPNRCVTEGDIVVFLQDASDGRADEWGVPKNFWKVRLTGSGRGFAAFSETSRPTLLEMSQSDQIEDSSVRFVPEAVCEALDVAPTSSAAGEERVRLDRQLSTKSPSLSWVITNPGEKCHSRTKWPRGMV